MKYFTAWMVEPPLTILCSKNIGIVRGGVQLDPFGTAATDRHILSSPGDYDDGEIGGMIIGSGNRSTRRKPAPVLLCPILCSNINIKHRAPEFNKLNT
jgi:hypothetical protein